LTVVGTRAYNTILNSGMSIEIINAWAQFVAALGVIGSLFYLAAQVRQSSRSSQALVVDSLARSMHDLAFAIAKDTELLRVLTEILPNWDASTEMDKARASSLILGYFKLFENAWFQMRKGMLEHDQWQGYEAFLRMVYDMPSVKKWWSMRRSFFAPGFADYVEQIKTRTDVRTFNEIIRS
jgi:hypothetical protein